MLIRRAEVAGAGVCDVAVEGSVIRAVGPDLAREPDETVLDAGGGALLPGLHDHHLHLFALAAARTSVRCGPPDIHDADELADALAHGELTRGWLRGVGYHESVAGPVDRAALDRLAPDVPCRVQHRSGALWVLNSRALAELGLDGGVDAEGVERDADGRATGRLFRLDAWLRERLGAGAFPDLSPVGQTLARAGVTGVTDATATNGPVELAALRLAQARGELVQRLLVMGTPELPSLGNGAHAPLARGPVKLVLAENALPALDALTATIARAHDGSRAVAIHCVTRAELLLALAALEAAGSHDGDRIEHASVTPPDAFATLASLGTTVVTQPNFVRERGDAYFAEVEPRDRPDLYRCRSLEDAGIALGGGTDAPFGAPDPWAAMRAAVDRRTLAGRMLGPDEALDPERALALFTTPAHDPGGAPRAIAPGALADLVLLDRPWSRARDRLDPADVSATLIAGCPVAERGD